MKINDLVKVVKQPSNQFVKILDLIGFVDDVRVVDGQEYISFMELNPNSLGGAGWIPKDCLIEINDNLQAQQLKVSFDTRKNQIISQHLIWSKKVKDIEDAAVKEACECTGVSMRNVLKIFKIYKKSESDIEALRY